MARPLMDDEAATLLRDTRRDMSAFEQTDLTLGDAIRRLVAWWRNEPTPGRTDHADGHRTEAMST